MGPLLLYLLASSTAAQPLPDRVDIPDGFVTVICPNEAAGRTMLADYYRVKPAPNNYTNDIDRFFAGLKATGCTQDRPRTSTVTIQAVIARRELTYAEGKENHLLYRGVLNPGGKQVIGIVDEDANNGYARTKLAQWTEHRTTDGWLDAIGGRVTVDTFYRCDTPEQAAAVVKALKTTTKARWNVLQAKLKPLLAAQGCRPARSRYFVTALRDEIYYDCGFECGGDLTAIEALDRSGLKVGLVYGGSEM